MDSARREDKSLNRPVKASPFNLAREMYNQLSEKSAISHPVQSLPEASSSIDEQHHLATLRQIEKTDEQSKSERVSEKLEEKPGDHLTNIETIDKKQAKFFVWLDGRGKNDPELLEKIESTKKLIKESNSIISEEEGVICYKNGSQIHKIEAYIRSKKLGISLQVWMFSYHWENAPEQTLQKLCLLRSEGQTLEEMDYILHQPHGEYQQEHLKVLQKVHKKQEKLLGEHDLGEIPLEFLQEQFNTLQEQFNPLKKHWNIM